MKISVVIPVYNDPIGIRETIGSLKDQGLPKEMCEIIIVDNGSQDSTIEVARELADGERNLIKVASEHKIRSSYAARNKGIDISTGEILCFLDADVTVGSNYLHKILECFNRLQVDYLGCEVRINGRTDTLSSKFNIVNDFPMKSFFNQYHFAPTCCLSVRRSVFNKVGKFDSRLESSGDLEFGRRVFEAGLKQYFLEDVIVNHPSRWKYRSLAAKAGRIGRGKAQINFYYPGRYRFLLRDFLNIRGYFPAKPWKLYKEYRNKSIDLGWWSAIVLAFFPLPLQMISLVALIRETMRLRITDNRNLN